VGRHPKKAKKTKCLFDRMDRISDSFASARRNFRLPDLDWKLAAISGK
jgi:hypothetical protein